MDYNKFHSYVASLNLSNYADDFKRFSCLMKELHPNGCNLDEEKQIKGEYIYHKVPLIMREFIREMYQKYDDLPLAQGLYLRFADIFIERN